VLVAVYVVYVLLEIAERVMRKAEARELFDAY
jgi:hypothetical protein